MQSAHPHVHCKACSEPVVMPTCECHVCVQRRDSAHDRRDAFRVASWVVFTITIILMSSLGGCWISGHFENARIEQLLRSGEVEVFQPKDHNGTPYGELQIKPKK